MLPTSKKLVAWKLSVSCFTIDSMDYLCQYRRIIMEITLLLFICQDELTPTQDLQESIIIIGIDHYKMLLSLCCQKSISSIVIDPIHVDSRLVTNIVFKHEQKGYCFLISSYFEMEYMELVFVFQYELPNLGTPGLMCLGFRNIWCSQILVYRLGRLPKWTKF